MLRTWRARGGPLLLLITIVVSYVITARVGLTLAMPPEKKVSAVWLPSGIALTAILFGGYRAWPGVWLGAFAANLWDAFEPTNPYPWTTHVVVSAGIAIGSTLQPLCGWVLLRRWLGRDGLIDIFGGAGHAFKFAGITALSALVASTVGVLTLALAGWVPWSRIPSAWWTWWVGDAIGILLLTPLVLSWTKAPEFPRTASRLAEGAVLFSLLLGVALFVFGGWRPWGIVTGTVTYASVPLLVWATFRFDHHGATAGILMVSSIAVWGTAQGNGPFVQLTLSESLLLLQTFVGILAITTLPLAGVLTERRLAERTRLLAIVQLERALLEIKTLRGLIPICAWCKKIRNDAGSWQQLETYLRQHTEAEFSHGICPECADKRLAGEV